MSSRSPSSEAAVRPDLILLDPNVTGTDGGEPLGAIGGDPGLRDLPVAVVAASRAHADESRARELGAAAFLTRPIDFRQLAEVVQKLAAPWIVIVTAGGEFPPPGTVLWI